MDDSFSPIQFAIADMRPLEESRQRARVLKLSADSNSTRQRSIVDVSSSADLSGWLPEQSQPTAVALADKLVVGRAPMPMTTALISLTLPRSLLGE